MVITLVGLSGCGKSHLAKRLAADKGFTYFGCDDLIAEKLRAHLANQEDCSVTEVAQWMGEPFEEHYKTREREYLSLEAQVIENLLPQLGDDGYGLDSNIVIDTTGSVIYLEEPLLHALKARSRIIYLATPKNEYPMMFQQYFEDPKPVVWGDCYVPIENESPRETMRRCYPELIEWRASRYAKLAEMSLVMDRENRDKLSLTRFLQLAGAR